MQPHPSLLAATLSSSSGAGGGSGAGGASIDASAAVPPSGADAAVSSLVTYGWGAIPVKARVGRTDFRTSLFPKGDLYLVPVKDAVRRAEGLELGDRVTMRLQLDT